MLSPWPIVPCAAPCSPDPSSGPCSSRTCSIDSLHTYTAENIRYTHCEKCESVVTRDVLRLAQRIILGGRGPAHPNGYRTSFSVLLRPCVICQSLCIPLAFPSTSTELSAAMPSNTTRYPRPVTARLSPVWPAIHILPPREISAIARHIAAWLRNGRSKRKPKSTLTGFGK